MDRNYELNNIVNSVVFSKLFKGRFFQPCSWMRGIKYRRERGLFVCLAVRIKIKRKKGEEKGGKRKTKTSIRTNFQMRSLYDYGVIMGNDTSRMKSKNYQGKNDALFHTTRKKNIKKKGFSPFNTIDELGGGL